MKYTVIVTIWIIVILGSGEKFAVPAICAGLHFMAMLCDEIMQYRKERTTEARKLENAITAVGLDIVNKLK